MSNAKVNLTSIVAVKKTVLLSVLLLVGVILIGYSDFAGQETDPFYKDLFKKGEKSFQTKNYKEAVKELEIAVFGLYKEKELRGKAYVYLSLSHYYLKDREKCEKYLREAFELLGDEGLKSLELDKSTRSDLEKLTEYFKLREAKKNPENNDALIKKIRKN
jgi:tetratricopeptide (TPR) repeat protein